MTWAGKRQLIIALVVAVAIGGAAFAYIYPKVNVAPTCSDMKQNGTETGVDCGGICARACVAEVIPPTVLWTRAFKIADSVYTAAASVENRNDVANAAIPYEFRLYDTKGIFVARQSGTVLLPPSGRYTIVETGIQTGNAVVGRAIVTFGTPKYAWQKIDPAIQKLRVSTSQISLDTDGVIPRLFVTLGNPSPTVTLRNISVAAVLYDQNGNAVTASKTFVSSISAEGKENIVFTWPKAFSTPIVRWEITPIIDVFATK